MKKVRLIHWNAGEAKQRAERLVALGYDATGDLPGGPGFLRELGDAPPDAVVIDLSRLPSQGRDFAVGIRQRKSTRHIPLVFVSGDPKKVARIRDLFPDAVFSAWDAVDGALEQAIAHPPLEPVVHKSSFAAYAGKPLWQKLGIKANSLVALVNAPSGFREILGELPDGAQLLRSASVPRDLTLWFVRSRDELQQEIAQMAAWAQRAPLWIAWPKKASEMASDLTQQFIRETGLGAGMVDYKVCSIDATWSGLLFTWRKNKK